MTAAEPFQLATLIVTVGAVAFAVAVALWAFQLSLGAGTAQKSWRKRLADLEERLKISDSIVDAHPGLVIVWEVPPSSDISDRDNRNWGHPKIHGTPSALASMLKFAELNASQSKSDDIAPVILDGICDYEGRTISGDEATLRQKTLELFTDGKPFSMTISGPSGQFIGADGRAAGAQLVIWLSDSTMRGLEESGGRVKLEEARRVVSEDPVAFLDIVGRAPVPMWRMNAAGKLEWVNSAYAEAVQADSQQRVLEDQILLGESLADGASSALKDGSIQQAVEAIVIKGERRSIELNVYPISGGVAGYAHDITDSHEARTLLKHMQRAHDETLNHMAEAVVVFDRSRKLSFYNTAFSKLFGLSEAFLNDRPSHGEWLDQLRERRILPEQADYAGWKESELAHYQSDPNAELPDELWALPDGRTFRVARQRHPMGGILLIFQDITDELDLRAKFQTQIKVQSATLDKLHEAVAVFGSNGKLRLSNAAFSNLWKLDGEIENATFEDIANACDRLLPDQDHWSGLKARITDPGPDTRKSMTGTIRRSDDTILTWLSHPLPDGATLVAWDDVTAARQIEDALRDRADALEASERMKTEFVEHVSYQLRTPLTTIQGYSDLIQSGMAGELSQQQLDYMGNVNQASGQLAQLIDDVLDIAAIDAGRLELSLHDIDLPKTLQDSRSQIATRADQKKVRVNIDDKAAQSAIKADASRVRQVLVNLLNNALDHVEEDGIIELGAETNDNEATLWVSDNGDGIAPEKQARIFERFQAGQGGGAGLGLALVNDIVRLHGGWVELESEPGKGTRVTCHFPLEAQVPEIRPAANQKPAEEFRVAGE